MHEPAVQPPTGPAPELLFERWEPAAGDLALARIRDELWSQPGLPGRWTCARLSRAAYVYREEDTGRSYVAKFYAAKTPADPERWAERELAATREALATGLGTGRRRACRPFDAWRGVLLLEYVDGLTLADLIAVRRSQPGALGPALDGAADLLAILHRDGAARTRATAGKDELGEARAFIEDLAGTRLFRKETLLLDGVRRRIEEWSARGALHPPRRTLVHGDATTTNFLCPARDETVAVDWERLAVGDPAGDVGRLAAEVTSGVRAHGGSAAEAEAAAERVVAGYLASCAPQDDDRFAERVRFHRATSTLRIARNGWVPALERVRLVAEASSLHACGGGAPREGRARRRASPRRRRPRERSRPCRLRVCEDGNVLRMPPRDPFGPRTYRGGRVRVYGCSPGCLAVSLLVSLGLTIVLNLLLRAF